MSDFSTFQSPFSWRYGSQEMRRIFSEEHKFRLWRKVWVALAKAQNEMGLVSKAELADLAKNETNVDIERILEIEKETRHDVVAALKEFAEKAKIGGGKIHLGATSMDINDNADSIRINEALDLIEKELKVLLKAFSEKLSKYSNFPCMGFTHLQPAEPTTLGYRLAFYAQDLLTDLELLDFTRSAIKGKGIKGAVGTSASYVKLLDQKGAEELESKVMKNLGLETSFVTNQTYPRKYDLIVANLLSSIAQSLSKFGFDLRIMQSPGFGELQEPFGKSQVGSSAMPFKKNPWNAEQICSLARLIESLSRVAWDNAASTLLERTLDDSANRRVFIPEMFLATDEILTIATRIVEGLVVNEVKVRKNLDSYWPFSASEGIIIEAVKKGADRQKMHELLRGISMKAWEVIQRGEDNPMEELLLEDKELSNYINKKEILRILDVEGHIGDAPKRTLKLARLINKSIGNG